MNKSNKISNSEILHKENDNIIYFHQVLNSACGEKNGFFNQKSLRNSA